MGGMAVAVMRLSGVTCPSGRCGTLDRSGGAATRGGLALATRRPRAVARGRPAPNRCWQIRATVSSGSSGCRFTDERSSEGDGCRSRCERGGDRSSFGGGHVGSARIQPRTRARAHVPETTSRDRSSRDCPQQRPIRGIRCRGDRRNPRDHADQDARGSGRTPPSRSGRARLRHDVGPADHHLPASP